MNKSNVRTGIRDHSGGQSTQRPDPVFFSNKKNAETPFFSPTGVQPKLMIGQPGDRYEQQSDQVADGVVQRKCADCEEEHIQMTSADVPSIQKEEGTSEIQDTVTSQSQDAETDVFSGEVDRREVVPAEGSTPQRTLSTLRGVRIEYNPNSCTITLPSKLNFEHPNSTNWPRCGADHGNPVPSPQLDSTVFDELKARYIRLTNQWLNGWYKVRLSNCEVNCADQDMDINVVVEEDSANPDTTVVLANTTGRSCAIPSIVTIHAQGLNGGGILDHRLIHESGHMSLGYFDEYPVSRGNSDEESVRRDDFSAAGISSDFSHWMQLHNRHFSFVPVFLEAILPNCDAELVEISQPQLGYEFTAALGYTDYEGGGYHLDLGVDFELFPANRSRDLQLFLGAHSHILLPLSVPQRTAFLVGARAGLEYTFGSSAGGFQVGAFGELGYGTFAREGSEGRYSAERFGAPYYMAGGTAGYSFAPSSGLIPFLNVTGGYGSTILEETEGIDSQNSEWFFLGLNTGFQWR